MVGDLKHKLYQRYLKHLAVAVIKLETQLYQRYIKNLAVAGMKLETKLYRSYIKHLAVTGRKPHGEQIVRRSLVTTDNRQHYTNTMAT